MKKYSLIILVFGLMVSPYSLYAGKLDEEAIENAQILAKANVRLEEFIQPSEEKPEKNKHWLTLEEFNFEYKGEHHTFLLANSFDVARSWGEIALYPEETVKTNISLTVPGSFCDLLGEPYRSNLRYQYIPAEGDQLAHFIIEKVEVGYGFDQKGYSQACLSYFVKEFVPYRTQVKYVFSDLRSRITQHYFPKFGFKFGVVEGYKFKRPLQVPYYLIQETDPTVEVKQL